MLKRTIIFLLLLSLLPCDKILKRILDPESSLIIVTPNVNELLEKALKSKNLEFNNTYEFTVVDGFLFFKAGHILDSLEANAIVVKCRNDTTYSVNLYLLKDSKWQLEDSISELEAFPWQFDLSFNDYNFDGQTDIYIQVSASNGWSLSRGHLILIDPRSKKFDLHKEARDFANMCIDQYSKTIISQDWEGYDSLNNPHLTIYTNKWINGQLQTINKRDSTLKH
jgi:hypothetical protein